MAEVMGPPGEGDDPPSSSLASEVLPLSGLLAQHGASDGEMPYTFTIDDGDDTDGVGQFELNRDDTLHLIGLLNSNEIDIAKRELRVLLGRLDRGAVEGLTRRLFTALRRQGGELASLEGASQRRAAARREQAAQGAPRVHPAYEQAAGGPVRGARKVEQPRMRPPPSVAGHGEDHSSPGSQALRQPRQQARRTGGTRSPGTGGASPGQPPNEAASPKSQGRSKSQEGKAEEDMPQVFRRLTAPSSPRTEEATVRTAIGTSGSAGHLSPERIQQLALAATAATAAPDGPRSPAAYLEALIEAHEMEVGHPATSSRGLLEEELPSMHKSMRVPEEEAKKIFDRLYKSGKDYRVRRKVYHELGLLVEQAKEAQTCPFEPQCRGAAYPGFVAPPGSVVERLYQDGFERRRRREEAMQSAPVPTFRPRTSLRSQLSPRDTLVEEGTTGTTGTYSGELGMESSHYSHRGDEPTHCRLFREHEERKLRQRMRETTEAEWRKHSYRPDISESQASGPRVVHRAYNAYLPQEEAGQNYTDEDLDEGADGYEVGELQQCTPGSSMVVQCTPASLAAAALTATGIGPGLSQGDLTVVSHGSAEAHEDQLSPANAPGGAGLGACNSVRLIPQSDLSAVVEAEALLRPPLSPGQKSQASDKASQHGERRDPAEQLMQVTQALRLREMTQETLPPDEPLQAHEDDSQDARSAPGPPKASAAAAEAAAMAAYHANQAMLSHMHDASQFGVVSHQESGPATQVMPGPTTVIISPRGAAPHIMSAASAPQLLTGQQHVGLAHMSGAGSDASLGVQPPAMMSEGGSFVTYMVPSGTAAPVYATSHTVNRSRSAEEPTAAAAAQHAPQVQQAQVQQMHQHVYIHSPPAPSPRQELHAPPPPPPSQTQQHAPAQPHEVVRGVSREVSAAAFAHGAPQPTTVTLSALGHRSPRMPVRSMSGRASPVAGGASPHIVTAAYSANSSAAPSLLPSVVPSGVAPSPASSGRTTPVMMSRPTSGGPPPARGRPQPAPHVVQQLQSHSAPGAQQVYMQPRDYMGYPAAQGGPYVVSYGTTPGASPAAPAAAGQQFQVLRQLGPTTPRVVTVIAQQPGTMDGKPNAAEPTVRQHMAMSAAMSSPRLH